MNLVIDFQKACAANTPSEAEFTLWIKTALAVANHAVDTEITVRCVDQSESQELNFATRNKAQPTNVLSFPFEQPIGIEDEEINNYLGDLVICSDIVITESQQQNKPLEAHWAHMCIHGCLHLLGFDHINNNDADKMESLETQILQKLSYANPYIE